MIQFSCRCGHRFSLGQEMAGSFTQCPKCNLLVDVPNLSDLGNIDADGFYKVKDGPAKDKPETFKEMVRTFAPSRKDESGNEYDLRPTAEDFDKVGRPGGVPGDEPEKDRPKYDPETGELVRPIPVAPERPSTVQPGDLPTLPRAEFGMAPPATLGQILLHLFMPANLLVQGLVILMCLAWLGAGNLLLRLVGGLWIIGVVYQVMSLPMLALVLAHYGYTIDETGPECRDDLPRPLRNLSWTDDLFGPFSRTVTAIMICFLPAMLLAPGLLTRIQAMGVFCGGPAELLARMHAALGGWAYPLDWVLWLAGICVFPAVLLTMNTTALLINLAPRRVWSVIRSAGTDYYAICLLEIVAVGIGMFQVFGRAAVPVHAGRFATILDNLDSPVGWLPLFLVGTYFAHAFAWSLGSLYRRRHDDFDWEMEGRPRPPLLRRRAGYVAPPAPPPADKPS